MYRYENSPGKKLISNIFLTLGRRVKQSTEKSGPTFGVCKC